MALPAKIKTQAFEKYIDGEQIPKIAEDLQIKYITIKKWSEKENWRRQRIDSEKRARQNIFFEFQNKIEELSKNAMDAGRIVSRMALEEIYDLYQKYPKSGKRKEIRGELSEWIKLIKNAADIQKTVIPEAQVELSEKILRELKKLNGEL